tara:strand:+ start:859 stop:1335 length:477 start_codon:yes stop_codon:yes gene_type:complete
MKRKGKKNYPKRHTYKVNDIVVFVFAGSKRIGHIVEQTWDEVGMNPKGHATYVIKAQNRYYPCVGVDGSKEFGNIISSDTHQGKITRTTDKPQFGMDSQEERGYKHLQLPKLKEMCKKHKLKVSGKKEQLVERLEKWYYETSQCGTTGNKKVNNSFFA